MLNALINLLAIFSLFINYEECKWNGWSDRTGRSGQLFINYEECKFVENFFTSIRILRYSLTMRNVNEYFDNWTPFVRSVIH